MKIPKSNKLNTAALSRIFDNKSESYKLFWFKAILCKIGEGKETITFDELINEMIVDAWYMVSEFKLNLGPSDTLEKIVKHIFEKGMMMSTDRPEVIKAYLETSDDRELRRMKKTLTLNVPYRLQAPFMELVSQSIWSNTTTTIGYINYQEGLIYKVSEAKGLDGEVYINPLWQKYISDNLGILQGWADYNLILYLQRRNPAVPGIPMKIYPPTERKLEAAKKYWKAIIETADVPNIYTGELLTTKDVSIDHFVPWSYVASDELWNLVPTTRSVNSSKSNNLPRWDAYFDGLVKVEYEAYRLSSADIRIAKLFEKCKKENINSDEILYRLYSPGQNIGAFATQLEEILLPIYDSARNMGFGEWLI